MITLNGIIFRPLMGLIQIVFCVLLKLLHSFHSTFIKFSSLSLGFLLVFFASSTAQGQTVCKQTNAFNTAGGTNASDGLQLYMTAAGNIQIKKDNFYQIYISPLTSSSSAYETPGMQGLCLSIGDTSFNTGRMKPTSMTDGGYLEVISNTCPADLQAIAGGGFKNIIVLKATTNNLDYYFTLTYSYVANNKFFNIDYQVNIPAGNTSPVRLSHGFDTYLNGGDAGPGFVNGSAPNYIMGVTKSGSYEAFNYVSGIPWSGYFSTAYYFLNDDLGSNNTFKNTINSDPGTDNGIGISMDFGSAPGTYSSNSNLIFECNAPATAPALSANTATNTCPTASVNLSLLITSTVPSGVMLEWRKVSDNTVVATPAAVTASGQYYVVFKDIATGCSSPNSTNVTVTIANCCNAGTTAPTLSATTITNCPAVTVNLNSLVSSTCPSPTSLEWHTSTGPSASDLVVNPTAVSLSNTYYAVCHDLTNNCYSPVSLGVVATITPFPAAPPLSLSVNPVCTGASSTLTATIISGATVMWSVNSTAATLGAGSMSGTTANNSITSTTVGIYTISLTQTVSGCTSLPATVMAVFNVCDPCLDIPVPLLR